MKSLIRLFTLVLCAGSGGAATWAQEYTWGKGWGHEEPSLSDHLQLLNAWPYWEHEEQMFEQGAEGANDGEDETEPSKSSSQEIIHYILVMDDDLGPANYPTPAVIKGFHHAFADRIHRELPHALVSEGLNTESLAQMDACLKGENPCQAVRDVAERVKRATRTIVVIAAHGGLEPYRAGQFFPAQSSLMNEHHAEFVLLTCSAGNLKIPEGSRSKVFGTGAKGMLSTGPDITLFLRLLGNGYFELPQSALEFYEAYKSCFYQTRGLLAERLLELFHQLDVKALNYALDMLEHPVRAYYIDSLPAKAWGDVVEQLPLAGTPWYVDAEKGIASGNKEGVWWQFCEATDQYFCNNVLVALFTGSIDCLSFSIIKSQIFGV